MTQAQTRCARTAKSDAFKGMLEATVVPLVPLVPSAVALVPLVQLVALVALVALVHSLAFKAARAKASAA